MAHCAKVIKGARLFSRRVIDLLKGLPEKNVRISLSRGFKSDLAWWKKYSTYFNGVSCRIQEQGPCIQSDASLVGYSVLHESDWVAGFFNTSEVPKDVLKANPFHFHWVNVAVHEENRENINVLEIIPILLAVNRFANTWRDKVVTWYSDNMQVVHVVNKGSSKNNYCMEVLRYVFWASIVNNFHLKCKHIPGACNTIPDKLSRIGHGGSIFENVPSICCSRTT